MIRKLLPTKHFSLLALALAASMASAQTDEAAPKMSALTLVQALDLARQHNGTVAAAYFTYLSSRALTAQARAAFFPTLTPSYTYTSDRSQIVPGPHGTFSQVEGSAFAATATWRVLDSGQREYNYLENKRSEESQFNTARQTLRQTLFNVQQQFYLTQEAVETLASAQETYDHAKLIDDQTKFSAQVGKTALKDTYQSEADLANAKFALLQARNSSQTSAAGLKSLIGYPAATQLPSLQTFDIPDTTMRPKSLKAVLDDGMNLRPDLIAQRKYVSALNFGYRMAEVNAGINLSLDTSFSETYSPDRYENRTAALTLNYPLFDGGASRAAARSAKMELISAQYTLLQEERDAKSQIETAYINLSQIAEQIDAAKEAVRAATQNFDAASAAYKEGAESIIDVSTARVSLATAQANLITAKYSYLIAELTLQLATGARMVGEPDQSDFGKGLSEKVPVYKP